MADKTKDPIIVNKINRFPEEVHDHQREVIKRIQALNNSIDTLITKAEKEADGWELRVVKTHNETDCELSILSKEEKKSDNKGR